MREDLLKEMTETRCSHEVRANGTRRSCFRNATGEHEGYPYCWQHLRRWTRQIHLSRPLMMIAMENMMEGDMLVADRVFRLSGVPPP